jgi:Ner family transcriptional regulator
MKIPRFTDSRARRIWVKAQLEILGKSFASIAREHGWHRNAVSSAMMVPLAAQERAIAEALGTTAEELFPERYDAETGVRLHAVRDNRRATLAGNDELGEAA